MSKLSKPETFRLADVEAETLDLACQMTGLSQSEFVRGCIHAGIRKMTDADPRVAEAARQAVQRKLDAAVSEAEAIFGPSITCSMVHPEPLHTNPLTLAE